MATYEEEKGRQAKKQYAYQYYLKKGYRPIEAAAIVGNLDIESGGFSEDVLNGKRKGDNGTAGYAAQWRGDRLDRLNKMYKDPKNLDNQLDFVSWELNNTHTGALAKLKSANTVDEATAAITWDYERPNKDLAHFDKRVSSAAQLAGVKPDPNFSYNNNEELASTYITPTPTNLDTSTTEYVEPDDNKEVVQAKQDIAEKSLIEDFYSKLSEQQKQIAELQQLKQQPQEQQPEDFQSPDMQDPYNYVQLDPGYNFEEFQVGGIVKDNIPNLQPEIMPIGKSNESQQFMIDYINSPNYKKRLVSSGYENPEAVISQRLKNIKSVKILEQNGSPDILEQFINKVEGIPYSTQGSVYKDKENVIIVDSKSDKNNIERINKTEPYYKTHPLIVPDRKSTEAHEMGHVATRWGLINNYDTREFFKRLPQFKVSEDLPQNERDGFMKAYEKDGYMDLPHDLRPLENKADLDALRFELKKSNIYDSGKETFTKEHLNKTKKSLAKQRLMTNYSEEDLIWLMNNIAQNQKSQNNNVQYAQDGGAIIDLMGQWAHPGETTIIPSNEITMQGVNYPVFGIDNLGNSKMMYPGEEYSFPGNYVTEYPQMQTGGTVSEIYKQRTGKDWSTVKLEGLTNGSAESNLKLLSSLNKSDKIFNSSINNNPNINFSEAFKQARETLGANKIFEFQGKKYGTNIQGEIFAPDENELIKNILKNQ